MLLSSLFDVSLPYQLLPCEVSFFINQCKCNSLTYSLFVNVFVSLDTRIFTSQCISLPRGINGQWLIFIETWKNVERTCNELGSHPWGTCINTPGCFKLQNWNKLWQDRPMACKLTIFDTHTSLPVSLLIELVPVGYSTWLQLYLLLHESKNIDHYNPDPKAKISNFPENMKVTMNLFHCFCFMFACSVNFFNR